LIGLDLLYEELSDETLHHDPYGEEEDPGGLL
jgi:hypothetical protein